MGETIPLGSIRGIRLGAHWSVLVIGWLVAWGLADGLFPSEAPGASDLACWVAAIVTVGLFWAGLMAHEVAHSVAAVELGVPVEGITLWVFGGVSRLRGEAKTPRAELRIALAGPVTSVVVAAAAGALAAGVDALDGPRLVVVSVTWLAVINGVLAAFNLVPAAPLDGGRVLHAIVWRRTGDRSRATVVATDAGRWFGYALVGAGVILLAGGDLGGMWFAFLGWFLLNAARAEATHVLVHQAFEGVRVRDLMTRDPITAPADITVAELLDVHLLRHRCSAVPLTAGAGRVVGLVTLNQLKGIPPARRDELRAADVAWPLDRVARAVPDDPVLELVDRIDAAGGGDGRALVFEHERLVGIVSPTDLNRALEVARLRPAGAGRSPLDHPRDRAHDGRDADETSRRRSP